MARPGSVDLRDESNGEQVERMNLLWFSSEPPIFATCVHCRLAICGGLERKRAARASAPLAGPVLNSEDRG